MTQAVHMDRATVRRILDGDQIAFRGLFDSYFPRLYRFALARLNGDHAAASDVVQQTFWKGFQKLDTYRGEAALYTWFCQVCRNAVVDYCRANNRELKTVILFDDQPKLRVILENFAASPLDQPETSAWQRDIQRLVEATVDALPDHYAEILERKYIDGLSVKEIAERMQLGAKAAESLLTRARKAFRQAIVELVDSPDALHPPTRNR